MLYLNRNKSHYILYKYIVSQYLISFCVAFVFIFFIFFINQILLLAKKVLLSNVDIRSMLKIIILAIPQFLIYNFPFASLSAASVLISDLSSSNEILALRSLGFSIKRIYSSIIIISIFLSFITYSVTDFLLPYTASKYQQIYYELLVKTPSMELKSNSSTTFGNIVISNGKVDGSKIEDIVLFDVKNYGNSQIISAKEGTLKLLDVDNYVYSLELINPTVIRTNINKSNDWNLANASKAIFYLDLSSKISSINSIAPSSLSSVDLRRNIKVNKKQLEESVSYWESKNNNSKIDIAEATESIFDNKLVNMDEVAIDYADLFNSSKRPINYYYQYYRVELHKKIAISISCFILVFITIPLSYLKFKHGKLVGFGISMFIAVIYWYFIFIGQLSSFIYPFNPLFIIWAPNIIFFITSLILIKLWRN